MCREGQALPQLVPLPGSPPSRSLAGQEGGVEGMAPSRWYLAGENNKVNLHLALTGSARHCSEPLA